MQASDGTPGFAVASIIATRCAWLCSAVTRPCALAGSVIFEHSRVRLDERRGLKKSVQQLKTKVRELLVPKNTDPWPEVRDDLNRRLRGWSSYFNLGSPVAALRSVDCYIRERVRGFLARRHKVAGRGTRWFTFDEIHRNREVLCLERLPRPAPLWALGEASRRAGCGDSARPVR